MHTLIRVIVKEVLQLRQDRRMIPIIFFAPIVQLVVFGFAVNTDMQDVPLVLVDQDRSSASRELLDDFVDGAFSRGSFSRGSRDSDRLERPSSSRSSRSASASRSSGSSSREVVRRGAGSSSSSYERLRGSSSSSW